MIMTFTKELSTQQWSIPDSNKEWSIKAQYWNTEFHLKTASEAKLVVRGDSRDYIPRRSKERCLRNRTINFTEQV